MDNDGKVTFWTPKTRQPFCILFGMNLLESAVSVFQRKQDLIGYRSTSEIILSQLKNVFRNETYGYISPFIKIVLAFWVCSRNMVKIHNWHLEQSDLFEFF